MRRRVLFYLVAHAETIETVGFVSTRIRNMKWELRMTRRTIYRASEQLQDQDLIEK